MAAQLLGKPLGPKELAAGTIACAGAALMPDLDHPQATIAYTFGPISRIISKWVNVLAGGHRQGTHSIVFAVFFGTLCQVLTLGGPKAGIITMFLLASFAFRALNIVAGPKALRSLTVLLEAAGLTWAMTKFMPAHWWWLGLAAAMGCIIHLMGDTLTPEGVPWLWPNKWRASIPIISHTGNIMEKAILSPIMSLVVLWLIWIRLIQPTNGIFSLFY
jgi:membrane-bound metal-dependent hydrolase YbcI (DUF457 family)